MTVLLTSVFLKVHTITQLSGFTDFRGQRAGVINKHSTETPGAENHSTYHCFLPCPLSHF